MRVTSKMVNTYLINIKNGRLRRRMVPDPSLAMNDVVMTSLLLPTFLCCQTPYYLSGFRFERKIMELDLSNKFNNMTS